MENQVIIPLCGVDESMTGFSINGWDIKKIDFASEKNTIADNIIDSELYEALYSWVDTEDRYTIFQLPQENQKPYFLCFYKETKDVSDFEPIVDVLRVIKSSQFGCWYPISLKDGILIPILKSRFYMTDAMQIRPLLSLSPQEREQALQLYQTRIDERFPDIVKTMLLFFHESCRSSNLYLSFITRVIILEMLIEGNAELSYRLKRSVAVLLGRDKEESVKIAESVNIIYRERSKFLHDGKTDKISDDLMDLTYDYARRVVANLMCIPDDIKNIRSTLEQAGYGDDPYKVTI